MADQTPAIVAASPHATALRIVNPILRALLRTPIAGSLRKQLMVLTYTGRKTGRTYSIPLSAHVIDGDLYAVTGARWKNNFRGGATASVLHDGKTTRTRGELIDDPAAVADLQHRLAESYGVKRAERTMGLEFRDQQRIPTLEEFTEAARRLGEVAIKLTPAG